MSVPFQRGYLPQERQPVPKANGFAPRYHPRPSKMTAYFNIADELCCKATSGV